MEIFKECNFHSNYTYMVSCRLKIKLSFDKIFMEKCLIKDWRNSMPMILALFSVQTSVESVFSYYLCQTLSKDYIVFSCAHFVMLNFLKNSEISI